MTKSVLEHAQNSNLLGFLFSPPLGPETRGVLAARLWPSSRGAPQQDGGARRPASGPDRFSDKAPGGNRSCHARARICLTVLACLTPCCLVGMSFRLRLPAISRSNSPAGSVLPHHSDRGLLLISREAEPVQRLQHTRPAARAYNPSSTPTLRKLSRDGKGTTPSMSAGCPRAFAFELIRGRNGRLEHESHFYNKYMDSEYSDLTSVTRPSPSP
jgi:hypothetical protein